MSEQDTQLEAELSLLLEGFVQDHQVFQSYGYENLYEQGYLGYDEWKTFQCSSTHLIIDQLDSAFHATSDKVRSHLHICMAAWSQSARTIKLLLEDGHDPNAFDPSMQQLVSVPLVEAIKHKNQEVADLLIDHGASVDGPYPDKCHSPLVAALEHGNIRIVTRLLSFRVSLKILDEVAVHDRWRFASTILEIGISTDSTLKTFLKSEVGTHTHWTKELRRNDETRRLIRAIISKNTGTVDLHLPNSADPSLGIAAFNAHDWKTVRLLLDTNINFKSFPAAAAKSALMAAVKAGDRDVVECLLTIRAQSNSLRDLDFVIDGQTPLMVAILHNDTHITQTLMDMGANPTFTTDSGNCFTIARNYGSDDMLQTLFRGTRVSLPSGDSLSYMEKGQFSYGTPSSQLQTLTLRGIRANPDLDLLSSTPDKPQSELRHRKFEDQQEVVDQCLKEIRLRSLRLEFRKQHSHITNCAYVSTLVHDPQPHESHLYVGVDWSRRVLSDCAKIV